MRSRQVKSRLIKLDAAAKRLGCHIETLRLRIRSGRLKASRGPHGAYYISTRSLHGLRVRKLPRLERRRPTDEEWEEAWETAAKRLRRQPRAFDDLLRFHQALKTRPSLNLRAYRLICAHGSADLASTPRSSPLSWACPCVMSGACYERTSSDQSLVLHMAGRSLRRAAWLATCAPSSRLRAFDSTSG